MNRVWNDANTEILSPTTPNPKSTEKKLPAHVGQPTNNPLAAPTLPIKDILLELLIFVDILNAYTPRAVLNPTNADTTTAKIIFNGINKTKKWFVT